MRTPKRAFSPTPAGTGRWIGPPHRMARRRSLIVLAVVASLVGIAEGALRLIWGFGTPVLYQWDADLEYRMVPNQSVTRFGKRIETNSLGLRSPECPATRQNDRELRVLVLGDSVVNGGSHVTQSDLATERLAARLTQVTDRPVTLINGSANSWGPANQLAFLRRYGTFDADIVVLVVSSHDLVDVPVHLAEAKAHPGAVYNQPWCALSEVAGLAWARLVPASVPDPPSERDAGLAAAGLAALGELLDELRARTPRLLVAMHWDREEQAAGTPRAAHDTVLAVVREKGIATLELGPGYAAAAADPSSVAATMGLGDSTEGASAITRGSPAIMHDRIHPTAFGQAALAAELFRWIEKSGWLNRPKEAGSS